MLAGIGGRTITEAKANISYAEFLAWMAYRDKHGPLDCARRIEHAAAVVAHTVSCTVPREKGSKPPALETFLMYERAAEPAQEVAPDLQTAMETWR
ncbi:hypothetical protein [Comamonas sp. GB3 AK4-5]|uniref:phage tail assembly protein T n=1 Tax=Comamonas sp. GB3 AK4-5 TaxID=3231487 RepID=UPI00351DF5F1